MTEVMSIDGSLLEGGGQILRMALGFSVLFKRPIRIYNIRAGRKKPGLMPQHLKGIELLRDISQATVKGLALGSREIEFHPGDIRQGRYIVDVGTAGSVSLLLQVSLPVAVFGSGPIQLDLTGGTNVDMAPQIDFMSTIFRPNMEKFGAGFDLNIVRRGFFPRGGGHCKVYIEPVRSLRPVTMVEFGEINDCFGMSFVSGRVPFRVADDLACGAKNVLERIIRDDIYIEKSKLDMTYDNCSSILLGVRTTTGVVIGAGDLGNRNKQAFQTGQDAANEISSAFRVRACVDRHVQDMMIMFMALADGHSKIKTEAPTMHTQTAIYVAEVMTKAKFAITGDENEGYIIECNGIGLQNPYQSN